MNSSREAKCGIFVPVYIISTQLLIWRFVDLGKIKTTLTGLFRLCQVVIDCFGDSDRSFQTLSGRKWSLFSSDPVKPALISYSVKSPVDSFNYIPETLILIG